jgi:hypothetical protein
MQKRFSLAIVVSAGMAVATLVPVSPAGAKVAQCKTRVYGPADSPVFVTSARGLTCTAAAAQQRRYAWTGKNTFRTPGGYRCAPSGRGRVGYQIRCVKGVRAYRIEFND